jgi:hypothetical protein
MSSTSEKSFGARLRKFQDAIQFANTWQGFSPPRPEESLIELSKLIDLLIKGNSNEAATELEYSNAITVRQNLFIRKPESIDKLLVPIRGAVEAQFGKQHGTVKNIVGIITKMRNSKLVKLPKDAANPDAKDAISQSEKSYGSKTQYFSDIVTAIESTQDYTSSNPRLTVAALQDKVNELHTANDLVATNLQKIRTIRSVRDVNYSDLAERMTRLKAYAKSQYGIKSAEYKSLTALGI